MDLSNLNGVSLRGGDIAHDELCEIKQDPTIRPNVQLSHRDGRFVNNVSPPSVPDFTGMNCLCSYRREYQADIARKAERARKGLDKE